MTNASSFEFEPYCIEANARTMAEFAAAMMRSIAEISVEHYGISATSGLMPQESEPDHHDHG